MKKAIKFFGLVCVMAVSAYNVYLSNESNNNFQDLVMENIDASATNESGMHGRPLLYSSGYGYKCANCSGNDCGAVC